MTLLNEARGILRQKYFDADVGITGANFLIAETGTSVIVTNEGNGDLTQILPKTHIVVATIEKIVPTLSDVAQILRVLARSATGQDMSVYTTLSTGPRRANDPDGPENYHVVILDNGRTKMIGTQYQDMLRCIRCGACMNHCPVYHSIGGHAYGWVYPGPMGAVLTPSLIGVDKAGPPAQRLDLLRPLRKRLPDENPAAENDAALARERVRAASDAEDVPLWAGRLGVLRQTAKAVSAGGGVWHSVSVDARARQGPLQEPAAGGRLDEMAGFACAAGTDVSSSNGRRGKRGSRRRDDDGERRRHIPPTARLAGQGAPARAETRSAQGGDLESL